MVQVTGQCNCLVTCNIMITMFSFSMSLWSILPLYKSIFWQLHMIFTVQGNKKVTEKKLVVQLLAAHMTTNIANQLRSNKKLICWSYFALLFHFVLYFSSFQYNETLLSKLQRKCFFPTILSSYLQHFKSFTAFS